jgi:hypothetical protein
VLLEPLDRRADIHLAQVYHQVDRPATAFVSLSSDEANRVRRELGLSQVPSSKSGGSP